MTLKGAVNYKPNIIGLKAALSRLLRLIDGILHRETEEFVGYIDIVHLYAQSATYGAVVSPYGHQTCNN